MTASLPEIDNRISRLHNTLLTLPRSDPLCLKYLSSLASARFARYKLSDENEDLDKSISHSTEAILLSFDPPIGSSQNIITTFSFLATLLSRRSQKLKQPDDLRLCIEYIRYLQDQSLESSHVTHSHITTSLMQALADQVRLESVDPMRNIREMATLCRELLTSTSADSEGFLIHAVKALIKAIEDRPLAFKQAPADEVIECLREATRRVPDLEGLSFELFFCLMCRFFVTRSRDDYEEAMLIGDKIIADPSRNIKLPTDLMGGLAFYRFVSDRKPENLEEAIFRVRAHLNSMSFEDPERHNFIEMLTHLEKARLDEFGVTSNHQEAGSNNTDPEVVDHSHLVVSQMAESNTVEFSLPTPEERNEDVLIDGLNSMRNITDLADIEKAIKFCRLRLASPHRDAPFILHTLGDLLFRAFENTDNIHYLDESIAVHRDLFKMPEAQYRSSHDLVEPLILPLLSRFKLFMGGEDLNEIMQLFPIASTDTRANIPDRFWISYQWTRVARAFMHPSTSTAYEAAISLIQNSLTFAPTLEIQHSRLVADRNAYEKLPLDHASYLAEISQLEKVIETLERGRGLLWSEMRGLRSSIDHLSLVNLPLAEKFAAVNRELEALTMSDSPDAWMKVNGDQVDGGEGMDPFGRLVVKQQKLVKERDNLISQIQAQPGFNTFLKAPSFDTLRSAAASGPVIIINHSEWRSDIIILLHGSPPSLIPTADDFYDHAKGLHDKLLVARDSGLDSAEYEGALRYVLEKLYDLVGRPVIQRLHELDVLEQSRVWWCPTSVFCSLPLHAMGPIRSEGRTKLYFLDLYIPSYTPTLAALVESRKPSVRSLDEPSMLLVVQPDTQMPTALKEMRIVQTVCPLVETLFQEKATPTSTLERLKHHRFAHISSHGILEIGKPFDSFFELYKGKHLTLLDIVRSQLPTAEFAFLSACHTAEIQKDSIANEGLHLAAAVQYSGFRSVVGTMWAMADIDGPVVAGSFYKSVFSDKWKGKPYYERTAEALRDAVGNLRKKRKMTLERWVNFVHYGA